nr:Zn-dependent hydrolase [Paracoccus sp. S-4012]
MAPARRWPADASAFAARLFDEVAAMSPDKRGVSRPAYSAVESAVLDHLDAAARAEGLETWRDAGGNLYAARAGTREAPRVMLIGSHVDSVPQGGNFDGLAGVVAGLAGLVRAEREGAEPPVPVHLVALRGEESAWFGPCYLGSRIATGQLTATELGATHRADKRPLSQHLADLSFDPAAFEAGRPTLDLDRVAGWLELHIEQGPVLIERNLPVAAVSGIRGNIRHREIRCEGTAGHSGAVPQEMRHDAVLAVADLLREMEAWVAQAIEDGDDLVFTCGMIGTDPARHALTRIPDEVRFSIDLRSLEQPAIDRAHAALMDLMASVAARRGVRFHADPAQPAAPARCDAGIVSSLVAAMMGHGLPPTVMASGAGHDAAIFAAAGVPSGMLFVRNRNGSHNPDEAMDLGDFDLACAILYDVLWRGMEDQMTSDAPPAFGSLAEIVRERGGGTYAFEAARQEALRLAREHPGHAMALHLAATAAGQVAQRFGREAVGARTAQDAAQRFEHQLSVLDTAAAASDPGRRLQLLNQLAAELLHGEV